MHSAQPGLYAVQVESVLSNGRSPGVGVTRFLALGRRRQLPATRTLPAQSRSGATGLLCHSLANLESPKREGSLDLAPPQSGPTAYLSRCRAGLRGCGIPACRTRQAKAGRSVARGFAGGP